MERRWKGDWEFILGIPLTMTSPTTLHQSIVGNILFELDKSLNQNKMSLLVSRVDWKICNASVNFANVFERFRK